MRPAPPSPLYRLLSAMLYPLWWLHALIHGLRHGLRGYPWLRLGGFESAVEPQIWVHGASVGEIRALAPLVHALIDDGRRLLVTSFTATGLVTARREFGGRAALGVIPIDTAWHCRAFFRLHPIRTGLIMETELWPELLYQAERHGVRLLQINARLSRRTLDRRGFTRRLLAATQARFELILTRTEADRAALQSLGADPARIRVIGNLKTRRAAVATPARLIERDYLLLASSHGDEERRFLTARPAGLADDLLLVVAPRHPVRGAELRALLDELGLRHAVRSRGEAIDAATRVYLADTLGELPALMAHARLVVMGGSFDDTGGHNLIEPASLGCPIVTGPADANVAADIALLGDGHGIRQVADMAECWRVIGELLTDPARAAAMGAEARARLARQPDMVEKYLAAIRPCL